MLDLHNYNAKRNPRIGSAIGSEDAARAQVLADETVKFGNPTSCAQAQASIASMEQGRQSLPNPSRVQLRYLAAWDSIEADLNNYLAMNCNNQVKNIPGLQNIGPNGSVTTSPVPPLSTAPVPAAVAPADPKTNYTPYLIGAGVLAVIYAKHKKLF